MRDVADFDCFRAEARFLAHLLHTVVLAGLAVLAGSPMVAADTAPPAAAASETPLPVSAGDISVLTYNVHGLPWPLASGRGSAMQEMEARLRDLRAGGRQPQILVLQEAFTPDAKAIGAAAGYRAIVTGGRATRLLDSGLEIASDLPIVDVRRMSFSACAGLDCLANKGAMMVTVMLAPGARLQVVATHLNSHAASWAGNRRANLAYRSQADALSDFIAANRNPALPLVVAGDFNTYPSVRWRYLLHDWPKWSAGGRPVADGKAPAGEKDRQFYTSGVFGIIAPVALKVVFGREADGAMLSDHIGYMIRYATRAAAPQGFAKG